MPPLKALPMSLAPTRASDRERQTFRKAFASIELDTMLNAWRDYVMNRVYSDPVEKLNTDTTADIELFGEPFRTNIKGEVRQRDATLLKALRRC
ncbi:unnamed protein product [Soboliphyme baturini]|uniref:PSD1 domain-containing protein n=1 Tax=Soboliphyme baturini TaxID=241478 RepID=A0A183IC19_9BILA|nr:unnamed protein product [Soboliphyme baturini]